MKDTRSGKVQITKLAAAQRQLDAAIRMYFAGEDDLAIHTIASAAYGLLRDIKKKRGQEEAADVYGMGIFYSVRDYLRGTLPEYLANDPKMVQTIRDWSNKFPLMQQDTTLEDFTVSVSPDIAKRFSDDRNKIANFLKHADRDVEKSISLDEIDNPFLLLLACSAYQDVAKFFTPEMEVYYMYVVAISDIKEGKPEHIKKCAEIIDSLDAAEQMAFCLQFIKQLKQTTKS